MKEKALLDPATPPTWIDWKAQHAGRAWLCRFLLAGEWALKWFYYWLRGLALFDLLELAGRCTVLFVAILWLRECDDRTKERHYRAWELINSARESTGDGGRKDALQALNEDGASLAGASLENAYLPGIDLKGANLYRAHLSNAELSGANFGDAKAWEANLEGANLEGANFQGTSLLMAHLKGANLLHVNFKRADLQSADLGGVNLTGAILQEANLLGAKLKNAHLVGANFEKANLSVADFEGVRGAAANFSGTNAFNANFKSAILWEANFIRSNLEGARLNGSAVGKANFEGSVLKGADFEGANFGSPKFAVVGISECTDNGGCSTNSMPGEKREFSIVFPPYYGNRVERTNLRGADLQGANISQEQVDAAIGDEQTRLPEGIARPAHWLKTGADEEQPKEEQPKEAP